MHEYSVVQALLNQCEEVAAQNNASKITKVITKIGVMSGIETHLLQTALILSKKEPYVQRPSSYRIYKSSSWNAKSAVMSLRWMKCVIIVSNVKV